MKIFITIGNEGRREEFKWGRNNGMDEMIDG